MNDWTLSSTRISRATDVLWTLLQPLEHGTVGGVALGRSYFIANPTTTNFGPQEVQVTFLKLGSVNRGFLGEEVTG